MHAFIHVCTVWKPTWSQVEFSGFLLWPKSDWILIFGGIMEFRVWVSSTSALPYNNTNAHARTHINTHTHRCAVSGRPARKLFQSHTQPPKEHMTQDFCNDNNKTHTWLLLWKQLCVLKVR